MLLIMPIPFRATTAIHRRLLRGVLPLVLMACASDNEPLSQEEYDARKDAACQKICDLEQMCEMPPTETLEECLAWCDEALYVEVETYPCPETYLGIYECAASIPDCDTYDRLSDDDPSAPCYDEVQANEACNEKALNSD